MLCPNTAVGPGLALRHVSGGGLRNMNTADARNLGGSEQSQTLVAWANDYIDLHGCKMPDAELIYLDQLSYSDIWAEYHRDTHVLCVPLCERQFKRVWDVNFKKFVKKRRRKPFGSCLECIKFKQAIAKSVRDKAALASYKEQFRSHLDEQKGERNIYYRHRQKGLTGAGLSIIMDGMDHHGWQN